MTVATTTSAISYIGTGTTAVYPYTWQIAQSSDLVVSTIDATGTVLTKLALTADYTVSGVGVSTGGNVTLTAGNLANGVTLFIASDPSQIQALLLQQGAAFNAGDLMGALDLLTREVQATRRVASNALQFPVAESLKTLTPTLPLAATRANKYVAFDASGNVIATTNAGTTAPVASIIQVVDTIAALKALAAPSSAVVYEVRGYYAAGDGGGGLFYWNSSDTTTDNGGTAIQPNSGGTGRWNRLSSGPIDVRWFGAKGDGSTDDFAAVQAAITYGNGLTSGTGAWVEVILPPATFRMNVGTGVTDHGLIVKTGVAVLAYGATVNLYTTGDVYGARLSTLSGIRGGKWTCQYQSGTGTGSMFHTPITVGCAYGDGGTVASPSAYEGVTDWFIRDVQVQSTRSYAVGVQVMGGAHRGLIEGVTVLDSSVMSGGIHMDWGTVGTVTSSDVPGTRTTYDAGLCYTTHPHHVVVRGCRVGNMTAAASDGMRLSGVHHITVMDVEIGSTTYAGFYHTIGDLGYEFAQTAVKPYRGRGLVVSNVQVMNPNNGWGFFCDFYADNIAAAVGGGYSPYFAAIYHNDALFEGCRTYGGGGASVLPGFRFQYMTGGMARNCYATGHLKGFLCEVSLSSFAIVGGEYVSNRNEGIYVGATTAPADILIERVQAYGNGTDGAYGSTAGIYLASGTRLTVRNCILGQSGETVQMYAIKAANPCTLVDVTDNYTAGLKNTGIAYLMASGTDYTVLKRFRGNTVAGSGVSTTFSGVNVVPFDYQMGADGTARRMCYAARASLTANITPTAGAWLAGETIFYSDPVAADFRGTTCVTAGTPGTWKRFGATEA